MKTEKKAEETKRAGREIVQKKVDDLNVFLRTADLSFLKKKNTEIAKNGHKH